MRPTENTSYTYIKKTLRLGEALSDNLLDVGGRLAYLRNWMLLALTGNEQYADEEAKQGPGVVVDCGKRNTILRAEVSFMFLLMSYINIIFLINYNHTCMRVRYVWVVLGRSGNGSHVRALVFSSHFNFIFRKYKFFFTTGC